MTRLIIFDLDGTLLDTLADIAKGADLTLEEKHHPTHTLEEYRFFIGNGIRKLVERALPEETRTPEYIQECLQLFLKHYDAHIHDNTLPYPGIRELLEKVKALGIRIAVASNKYQSGTEKLICHFWGTGYFDAVYGQRENIPVKPDPTIVEDILQATGFKDKSEVLYVGDSGVDMQTARNSGLTSVGVSWGCRPRQELESNGACHIIDRPEELLSLLAE